MLFLLTVLSTLELLFFLWDNTKESVHWSVECWVIILYSTQKVYRVIAGANLSYRSQTLNVKYVNMSMKPVRSAVNIFICLVLYRGSEVVVHSKMTMTKKFSI